MRVTQHFESHPPGSARVTSNHNAHLPGRWFDPIPFSHPPYRHHLRHCSLRHGLPAAIRVCAPSTLGGVADIRYLLTRNETRLPLLWDEARMAACHIQATPWRAKNPSQSSGSRVPGLQRPACVEHALVRNRFLGSHRNSILAAAGDPVQFWEDGLLVRGRGYPGLLGRYSNLLSHALLAPMAKIQAVCF